MPATTPAQGAAPALTPNPAQASARTPTPTPTPPPTHSTWDDDCARSIFRSALPAGSSECTVSWAMEAFCPDDDEDDESWREFCHRPPAELQALAAQFSERLQLYITAATAYQRNHVALACGFEDIHKLELQLIVNGEPVEPSLAAALVRRTEAADVTVQQWLQEAATAGVPKVIRFVQHSDEIDAASRPPVWCFFEDFEPHPLTASDAGAQQVDDDDAPAPEPNRDTTAPATSASGAQQSAEGTAESSEPTSRDVDAAAAAQWAHPNRMRYDARHLWLGVCNYLGLQMSRAVSVLDLSQPVQWLLQRLEKTRCVKPGYRPPAGAQLASPDLAVCASAPLQDVGGVHVEFDEILCAHWIHCDHSLLLMSNYGWRPMEPLWSSISSLSLQPLDLLGFLDEETRARVKTHLQLHPRYADETSCAVHSVCASQQHFHFIASEEAGAFPAAIFSMAWSGAWRFLGVHLLPRCRYVLRAAADGSAYVLLLRQTDLTPHRWQLRLLVWSPASACWQPAYAPLNVFDWIPTDGSASLSLFLPLAGGAAMATIVAPTVQDRLYTFGGETRAWLPRHVTRAWMKDNLDPVTAVAVPGGFIIDRGAGILQVWSGAWLRRHAVYPRGAGALLNVNALHFAERASVLLVVGTIPSDSLMWGIDLYAVGLPSLSLTPLGGVREGLYRGFYCVAHFDAASECLYLIPPTDCSPRKQVVLAFSVAQLVRRVRAHSHDHDVEKLKVVVEGRNMPLTCAPLCTLASVFEAEEAEMRRIHGVLEQHEDDESVAGSSESYEEMSDGSDGSAEMCSEHEWVCCSCERRLCSFSHLQHTCCVCDEEAGTSSPNKVCEDCSVRCSDGCDLQLCKQHATACACCEWAVASDPDRDEQSWWKQPRELLRHRLDDRITAPDAGFEARLDRFKGTWEGPGFDGTGVQNVSYTCDECVVERAKCSRCEESVCGNCLAFCPRDDCRFRQCSKYVIERLLFNPFSHPGNPFHRYTGLTNAKMRQAMQLGVYRGPLLQPICLRCKKQSDSRQLRGTLVNLLLRAKYSRASLRPRTRSSTHRTHPEDAIPCVDRLSVLYRLATCPLSPTDVLEMILHMC